VILPNSDTASPLSFLSRGIVLVLGPEPGVEVDITRGAGGGGGNGFGGLNSGAQEVLNKSLRDEAESERGLVVGIGGSVIVSLLLSAVYNLSYEEWDRRACYVDIGAV
jgi:hypothetical protein